METVFSYMNFNVLANVALHYMHDVNYVYCLAPRFAEQANNSTAEKCTANVILQIT